MFRLFVISLFSILFGSTCVYSQTGVAVNLDSSNPDVNTMTDIKSGGSTSTYYGIKIKNSAGTNQFVVRSDGNTGIGTASPDNSALLEIFSSSKGILFPQVALTANNAAGPITSPATGLFVYNTATVAGVNGVSPGYYYNSGTSGAPIWVKFSAATSGPWLLTGNSGTVPTTSSIGVAMTSTDNFIGTKDAVDFVLGTNNLERLRVKSAGNIGINTQTPVATALVTINPNTNAVRSGIDITLTGATATARGLNISTANSNVDGVFVGHTSSSTSNSYFGVGATSTGVVSRNITGYLAYRTNSGNSYGVYGTGDVQPSAWAGYFQGRTVITSETAPTSAVDFEVRNVTAGAANPPTISMRQTTSLGVSGSVMANLNFSDNYSADGTVPQARIQVIRGATSSNSSDLPTDIIFSNMLDGSSTLSERVRIKNNGFVGININNPTNLLHVYQNDNTDKNAIYSYSSQVLTGVDYQSRAIVGQAKGANATYGYSIGLVGLAEQVNSWHSTGIYAGLSATIPASLGNDQAFYADGSSLGYSGIFMNGNVGIGASAPSQTVEVGGTNAQIYMNSASSNMLYYSTAGVAAPAFTTRSFGSKIVLYPQTTATSVDYAIGIENATLWNSVPQAISTYLFKWYAGTNEMMRLRGDGRLAIGLTNPTATRLHAYDPSAATSRIAIFRNSAFDGTEVQTGSVEYLHDYVATTDFNDGANGVGLSINFAASSSYDLQVANNSAAKPTSGSWTIASDARLKDDVQPFKEGLEVLKNINPVYFHYNGKAKTPNEYGIGVLAQDLAKAAPYMVGKFQYSPTESLNDIEEYLSFNPDALHYITLNAVKELDQKQQITEQFLSNISDFGTIVLQNETTFIPYHSEFLSKLNPDVVPIVTLSEIGNQHSNISILSKNNQGFTVKVHSFTAPVEMNWIAMANVKKEIFNIEKNYSNQERSELIQKVKLPEPQLKQRFEKELNALKERRAAGEFVVLQGETEAEAKANTKEIKTENIVMPESKNEPNASSKRIEELRKEKEMQRKSAGEKANNK